MTLLTLRHVPRNAEIVIKGIFGARRSADLVIGFVVNCLSAIGSAGAGLACVMRHAGSGSKSAILTPES